MTPGMTVNEGSPGWPPAEAGWLEEDALWFTGTTHHHLGFHFHPREEMSQNTHQVISPKGEVSGFRPGY